LGSFFIASFLTIFFNRRIPAILPVDEMSPGDFHCHALVEFDGTILKTAFNALGGKGGGRLGSQTIQSVEREDPAL
jgi:hypothetical protein